MSRSRKALGEWGEAQAEAYLVRRGYKIIERNFRTPEGEIDLVVLDDQVLVFVEVKTRTSEAFGRPEAAITDRKLAHLSAAAEAYLQQNPDLDWDCRIDVIAIRRKQGDRPEISHIQNVILGS